jgi:16S rRNA (cytosine1402-N4)-methyltransferase
MNQKHIPVLLQEVLQYLDPHAGEHYLDLTAGYGGHARRVRERVGQDGEAVLVDRDNNAIDHLRTVFQDDPGVTLLHNDYLNASRQLVAEGQTFDLILADIGLSSPHIDNAERGFSFQNDGPLDMRMDQRQSLTAAEIVNEWTAEQIAEILRLYGEIRGAGRMSVAICEGRPYQTTTQLARVINASTRGYPKVRLEAQVFQALRIAVNGELQQLQESLPLWQRLLKPGGRLGVISFHSLEDRMVKRYFMEHGGDRYDADLRIITKQPVTGTSEEIVFNPRARSAKLRVAQRK